jgi:hypothetical protein
MGMYVVMSINPVKRNPVRKSSWAYEELRGLGERGLVGAIIVQAALDATSLRGPRHESKSARAWLLSETCREMCEYMKWDYQLILGKCGYRSDQDHENGWKAPEKFRLE